MWRFGWARPWSSGTAIQPNKRVHDPRHHLPLPNTTSADRAARPQQEGSSRGRGLIAPGGRSLRWGGGGMLPQRHQSLACGRSVGHRTRRGMVQSSCATASRAPVQGAGPPCARDDPHTQRGCMQRTVYHGQGTMDSHHHHGPRRWRRAVADAGAAAQRTSIHHSVLAHA